MILREQASVEDKSQDCFPKGKKGNKDGRHIFYLLVPRIHQLRSLQLRVHDPLFIPHRLDEERPPRSDDAGAAVAEHVVCGPGGAVGLVVAGVGGGEGWVVGGEVGDLVVVS